MAVQMEDTAAYLQNEFPLSLVITFLVDISHCFLKLDFTTIWL